MSIAPVPAAPAAVPGSGAAGSERAQDGGDRFRSVLDRVLGAGRDDRAEAQADQRADRVSTVIGPAGPAGPADAATAAAPAVEPALADPADPADPTDPTAAGQALAVAPAAAAPIPAPGATAAGPSIGAPGGTAAGTAAAGAGVAGAGVAEAAVTAAVTAGAAAASEAPGTSGLPGVRTERAVGGAGPGDPAVGGTATDPMAGGTGSSDPAGDGATVVDLGSDVSSPSTPGRTASTAVPVSVDALGGVPHLQPTGVAVPTALSGDAAPTTPANPAPLLQQLTPSLARVVARGDGVHQMSLRLHPADLGEIHLTVTVRGDRVDVEIAARPEARALLHEGSAQLRGLLESVGRTAGQLVLRDLPSGAPTGTPTAAGDPGQSSGRPGADTASTYDGSGRDGRPGSTGRDATAGPTADPDGQPLRTAVRTAPGRPGLDLTL